MILNINHDSFRVSQFCENTLGEQKQDEKTAETMQLEVECLSELENSVIGEDNLILLIHGSLDN